jgi:acyl-CoA reductase-like NAD-dependent aldehyde dehydrogenase
MNMIERLKNHLAGQWQAGTGSGVTLYDPVLGTPLVEVDATGLDLPHGFTFARSQAGPALRAMTYQARGAMLGKIATVLQSHRDRYYEISTTNSGTVKNDTAVDVDGGIYTLSTYARLGEQLGARRFLLDGEATKLGKDPLFQSQHILSPRTGLALFINAFNFPSWGLWEKAAQAIGARLQKTTVGNPRNDTVRMGSLVSREQYQAVAEGIGRLSAQADLLFDGRTAPLMDADPVVACCVGPVLLGCRDPEGQPLGCTTWKSSDR